MVGVVVVVVDARTDDKVHVVWRRSMKPAMA
jgi:hypothetical protein